MNRFLLALPMLLTGLLSSCNIIVQPGPNVTPPSPLRVLEATYSTNYASPDGQPAICDSRPTTITYTFRYQGQLESWSSYLKGQTLGKVSGSKTFTPTSSGVSPYETSGYEVIYTLDPNTAPYAATPDTLSPQGIIVTPVPPIGTTQLYLILKGADSTAPAFTFKGDIPVYINC